MIVEIKLEMLNNDYLFVLLGGLLAILFLFIDKCIFCKTNEEVSNITYFKKVFICIYYYLFNFINKKSI